MQLLPILAFGKLMKLFSFLQALFTEGKVTVEGQLFPFEQEDEEDSVQLLAQYYEEEKANLPSPVPLFSAGAAMWAARHLYLSLQLIVIRDAGEETISKTLPPYDGILSPDAVSSADLVLRYLPDVLSLAKGLAPADIMVKRLCETAAQWPFSSVGISLNGETADDTIIMNHPSLRITYIDRIIKRKDSKRAYNKCINQHINEALGLYAHSLWAQFSATETDDVHAK